MRLFLFITIIVQTTCLQAQLETGIGASLQQVAVMMQKHHISPRILDDSLASDVTNEMIDLFDPYGLIFMEKDIEAIHTQGLKLDENILKGSDHFFNFFCNLYAESVKRSEWFLEQASVQPLALQDSDTMFFIDVEKTIFSSDTAALLRKWRRYIKYNTFMDVFDKDSASDSVFSMSEDELISLAESSKQDIVSAERRELHYYLSHPMGYLEVMKLVFLNLITSCYDPHSAFFNPEMNKWFEAEVSASGYTFGMEIESSVEGEVKVSRLVPGGPAWRSGVINQGDVLLSGKWQGSELYEFSSMNEQEVAAYLARSIDKAITFSIRKADGQIREVTLKKEKMRQAEDVVRSVIIDDTYRVGYLVLPAFYNEAGEGRSGCANDVAKEILKLKKDSIEGLILDLRYNGGGSIEEALDLAGIFIDAGPVCMISDLSEKPVTLKDMNRGLVWDGPLMILINSHSASASEIVAAALQDHHRALIAGQCSYGKASGQLVIPADTHLLTDYSNIHLLKKNKDFIKLTIMRIYRIDGSSHQQVGVVPDIILRNYFFSDASTERDDPYALPNDSIEKKAYYTALTALPVDTLNQLHENRIMQNEWHVLAQLYTDSIHHAIDTPFIPFNLTAFRNYTQQLLILEDQLDQTTEQIKGSFEVKNHSYDNILLQTDEFMRFSNEEFIRQTMQDIEIVQAVYILNDFIRIQKPTR